MSDWRPTASIETLQSRSELMSNIREFFAARKVLEVDTPLLASTTGTDPHLQSMEVRAVTPTDLDKNWYLQTSPEFAMKRLLASGSGPIYQLCKSFRQDELGRNHNPEFTMLEWYRPGFSMPDLMDEVEQLVNVVGVSGAADRLSYQQLFEKFLAINPHNLALEEAIDLVASHISINTDGLSIDDCLQLLMDQVIEPQMSDFCFVYDYPVTQAALARIGKNEYGRPVAKRFELFIGGLEIANGYWELLDATEQRQRFQSDNRKREQAGIGTYPLDEKLIAALESGMPDCSGVALGVDRLLMRLLHLDSIAAAIPFPTD